MSYRRIAGRISCSRIDHASIIDTATTDVANPNGWLTPTMPADHMPNVSVVTQCLTSDTMSQ